jgi:transcriptional regulator with XRE-family HTH domain
LSELGERLKQSRVQAGLGLREFARLADVSPSLVSQIESGRTQPSIATLLTLARILNVSIDGLLDHRIDPDARPAP